MTLWKWSTTAANNDDIDSSINFQEGQSPASVNNSCRAMMAAIAKWRDDMSGNTVTGGTSTAYTATSSQGFTSLTDGISIALRMSATNGASPTLNVDSLGAKSIATLYGTAVGTGKLLSGAVYVFVYDATDDKWIVQGNPNYGQQYGGFESGTSCLFYQAAAPTGWTVNNSTGDVAVRMVSGTSGLGGSAGGSGGFFSEVFASRTIAQANLPSYNLNVTDPGHTHTNVRMTQTGLSFTGPGGGTAYVPNSTEATGSATTGITVASGGSGTAMDFAVKYINVIVATRD